MNADTGSLSAVELFLALGGLNSWNQGARQAQSPKYPELVASRFLVSCPRRIKKGRQGVSKSEGDVREKQERRPSYTSERSGANYPAQLSFPGFILGTK